MSPIRIASLSIVMSWMSSLLLLSKRRSAIAWHEAQTNTEDPSLPPKNFASSG